ncbi:hypothetical protein KP509_38G042800 [Ceratopteris richardii]|uniref:Uncharacterized protein n=1 Tax=Ceratopteris richardii TaxID=49495 RepID=A0A8T2Q530_CERRI|nr:hypothetical protein KP509_38G042800 [Ceratopteris richardii]
MPNFGKNNWRMQSIGSVITQKGKAVLGIAAQQIASGSRPNDLVTLAGV